VPILLVHRMSQKQVRKEMEPFPLRHVETVSTLPWQHVIIFEKRENEPEKPAKKEEKKKTGSGQ